MIQEATPFAPWLNLQNDYDVQIAKRDIGRVLDRIEAVNKPKAA